MHSRLILGAMSGTSADGVDVALTHITGRGMEMQAKLLAHAYHPYTPELRKQILEMRQRGDVRLSDLAEMGRQVTLAYVEACKLALKQGNVTADQVAAIAAHGQTLFHGPPNTIQYFDPSLLAYETGIAVVSDFRRADLAAGGQGAPLVPFADWILFRHPTKSRVILNIGGIANITYLKAGGSIDEVIAFDTGPGNCWSDWLMQTYDNEGRIVDDGGRIALQGSFERSEATQRLTLEVQRAILDFKHLPPPRSFDGPDMNRRLQLAIAKGPEVIELADLLAIANAVMADCVAVAGWVAKIDWSEVELFVAGGGARNASICHWLERWLKTPILPLGDAFPASLDLAAVREALAFALLGAATLDGEPSNVPSATGASRRVVLGSITPKPV